MRAKNKVIAFLSLVIVVMAVAYAAFSANLIISGTANIASEWNVLFTNIEQISKSSGVDILSAPQANGTTATFDIGLSSPGDSIEYKITVSNEGTLDAIIENIEASETGNEAIIFEISNIKTGDILNAKKSTTFNIKITYNPNTNSQPTELENKLIINVTYAQYIGQNIDNSEPTINGPILTQLTGTTSLTLQNSAGKSLNNYIIGGNSVKNENNKEIQSVGEKTKNLFDIGDIDEYFVNLTTLSVAENSITGIVKNSWAGSHVYKLTNYPSGQYYIKFEGLTTNQARFMIRCFDNSGTQLDDNSISISNLSYNTYYKGWLSYSSSVLVKIPKTVSYWQIGFLFDGTSEEIGVSRTITNIQITEGTKEMEYEPYGYKIPVKLSSSLENITYKNGYYIDGNNNEVEYLNAYKYTNEYISVLPNTEYELVFTNGSVSQSFVTIPCYDKNKGFIQRISGLGDFSAIPKTAVFTTPDNCHFIRINMPLPNYDIEFSTTNNIFLDEPLRCISDNCDYIDFEKQTVTRVIKEMIFTGAESWELVGTEGNEYRYYGLKIGDYGSVVAGGGLSTHFERTSVTSYNTNIGFDIINSTGYNHARVVIRPDNTIVNLEKWKEYLAEQYEKGTPFVVQYVSSTEDSKTISLPTIHTLSGNSVLTVVTNDGVSVPLNISYYKMR